MPTCGAESSTEAPRRAVGVGLWCSIAALHTDVGMARLPATLLVISWGVGEGKKPHGNIAGVGL